MFCGSAGWQPYSLMFHRTGTDEVMQLLEDVSLNLQSMLSSRFVQPFADEV